MSQWFGISILLAGLWSGSVLLAGKRKKNPYFPTLDLRGWGVGRDFLVPSEFPESFAVGSSSFRPLIREGKIQGWWVKEGQEKEEFWDDSFLEDQWGEDHVKILLN